MALKDDLETRIEAIIGKPWTERKGTVVPSDTSIALGNDAVKINATILYADLADSTKLVDGYKDWFAAEVYKSFLHCAAKIISSEGGTITAYDGDRIMAVFIGDSKNTSAVRSALKINWACSNIIQKRIKEVYKNATYVLNHVCGVDTSDLFVAKTGIRGANDLVWVGRSANYAAKLAALDHAYPTWITADVYNNLNSSVLSTNGTSMWTSHTWNAMNNQTIYASKYWWSL